jgi:hypothetical protein
MIKVTYGAKPGVVVITHDGQGREPIQIWDSIEVFNLINELTDAWRKAWPKSDLRGTTPHEQ